MAPHDRAAQRPLALRDVGRTRARQVEPALEPLVDRGRREEPDPRGGQLDGERHAAEVGDDRGDVAGVGAGDRESRLDRARRGRRTAGPTRTPASASGSRARMAAGSCSRSSGPRRSRSGGVGRPGTGYSCSPEIRSGARLVARIRIRPARRSSSPRSAPAPRTCSRLSRTSSACFGSSSVASTSIGLRDGSSPTPIARAIAGMTSVGVRDAAQRHEPGAVRDTRRRGWPRPAARGASCRCRPGPVSVTSRVRRRGAPASRRARAPAPRTTSAPSAGCWAARRASGSAGSPRAGRRSRAARSAPAAGP